MQLTNRNILILKIIIEEYIKTGEVLGSKSLLKKYNIGVSSATIRGDMMRLENMNLIFQPYNSAGRLPTSKGLRAFVDYLMSELPSHILKENNVDLKDKNIKSLEDYIHKITRELAQNTGEIAFLGIPEKNILNYSGISKFLKKNHQKLGNGIYAIIDILEDKLSFLKFINSHNLILGVNVFIGEENIIPYLKDFTLIVKPIQINGEIGYIGIIGTLQMNYSFNISAVKGII